MDYSTVYFGRPLDQLRYQDIVDYFKEPREESTRIEFKSFSKKYGNFNDNLEGVIRAVCAFLNAEGGIIIWGAPEGVTVPKRQFQVYQGELTSVTELKEKDSLISKISDSITPLPVGVNVKILQESSNLIYIFEVQPSNYSPHQYRNTYYARLDGQTKPAPHYLIDALFKKIRYPNIEGYIKLEKITHNGKLYLLDISIIIFNFSPLQNEENVSYRLMCEQGTFPRAKLPSTGNMYMYDGHQLIYKDFIDVLHFGAPNIFTDRIVFEPNVVASEFGNEVTFLLTFGGKHSPLKTSSYKLNFNRIDWNKKTAPNYLFTSIEENILPIDKQKDLGITKEKSLKEILGR